jgi:hypothetical protein
MAQRMELKSRKEGSASPWERANSTASAMDTPAEASGSYSPLDFGLDLQAVWSADESGGSGRWLDAPDAEHWSNRNPDERHRMASVSRPTRLRPPPDCGAGSAVKTVSKWSIPRLDEGVAAWGSGEKRRVGSQPLAASGNERTAAPASPSEHATASGPMQARSVPSSPFYPRSPISSSSSSLATAASASSPSGSMAAGDRRAVQTVNTSQMLNHGATAGAGGPLASGAAAQLADKSNIYPCREGAPDCLHYLKTGRCQFGARCKFNHPPRDARLIDSLNRRDCFDWVMTGSCPYGTSCKYNHPALNATERPVQLHQMSGPVGVGGRDARRRPNPDRGADTTPSWGSGTLIRRSDDFHRADSAVSGSSVPSRSPTEISWLVSSPRDESVMEKRVGSWPSVTETRADSQMWSPSHPNAPGSRGHSALKPFNAAPGTPVHRPIAPPSTRSPQTYLPTDISAQALLSMPGGAAHVTATSAASSAHSPTPSIPGMGAMTLKPPVAPSMSDMSSHSRSQPGTNVNAMPFASSPILSNTWTAPGYLSEAQRHATETLPWWNDETAQWPPLESRDTRPPSETPDVMYRLAPEKQEWNASAWAVSENKMMTSGSSAAAWTGGRTPNEPELTAGWLDGLSPPLRPSTAPSSSPVTRCERVSERSSAIEVTSSPKVSSKPLVEHR